jgi:hypothetical protein
MPLRIGLAFEPAIGDCGAQIGWASATLDGTITGLTIRRIPVFRGPSGLTFGAPQAPGNRPSSRHSLLTFDTDQHRQRFQTQLANALRAAHPEIFQSEGSR